jgi:aminopeptidase N
VEPEFEQDARAIFPYTVEMLDFFSKKLGVKYPWPKYSQVVVRDYVSGAMENTTAVIFGEFMQRPRRELIDERTNEKIVAHEMFHHWFGDLVTCESWANLTMNEGFANYSEYLWLEHKYGADEADFHLLQDWSGYFSEARNKIRPIIDFGYENKEDMFDAHSYNKGGAVLHMLRDYVGDEAFWAALREYLTDHAYTAVEAHHLRLAFEAVTGEDLNWFFNQWFFREGHPRLNVTYGYDSEEGVATVSVEQTQDPDEMPPIFELPAAIDIYLGEGEKQRHQVRVNQRRQTFSFPVQQQPRLINFDANKVLLAESEDNKTEEELIFQYFNAPRFYDRLEALQHLSSRDNPEARKVFQAALNDPFWLMRSFALARVDPNEGQIAALLRGMALNDPHSQVRASALGQIAEIDDPAGLEIAKQIIQTDSAYNVIAAALELLTQRDPAAALEYAGKLENERSADLLEAISNIYAESGDAKYLPFFRDNLNKIDGFQALSFYTNYHTLILDAGDEAAAQQTAEELRNIALNTGQSPWRRLAAMKSLNDMRNEFQGRARETSAPADKARLEELVLQISKYMYQQLQLMEGADE